MTNATKPTKDVVLMWKESETVRESIINDTYTAAILLGTISLAHWLDRTFIEVFGACMLLMWATSKALAKTQKRRTPQEAADYLRAEYGVTANDPR